MKKEDLLSIFVYLIMISLTLVLGLTVVKNTFGSFVCPPLNNPILMGFIYLFVGIILNAMLIEFGHIIGALLGGYAVYSINVLYFNFYKKDKKWKFRFKTFDGLSGETKIISKNKPKSYLNLYCLFPFIAYLLLVSIFIVLFMMKQQIAPAENFHLNNSIGAFMFFVIIGGVMQIYQIMPFKLDCKNDGYILTLISKKEKREAYEEFLKIQYAQENMITIPEYKVFENINDFSAEVNLFAVYDKLDKAQYEEAEKIIDLNLLNIKKISKNVYFNSLSHKIFILLVSKGVDECKKFCESNIDRDYRKFVNSSISSETVRAYILISGLIEDSESETRNAIKVRDKALKKFPVVWKEIENKLFDVCIEKINEVHPEWKIKEKQIV